MTESIPNKSRGAVVGMCIGDALAMPVHWYYNRHALFRDYGRVTDYLAPRHPHPDSILWRSSYKAPNSKGEILHDQAPYWGQKNIHYHQFLKAGENTLNVKICRLLIDSLNQRGAYEPEDFLNRYIAFMTTPGNHRDTYIEEYHRNFFENYANGIPPDQCGENEKHIGGLVGLTPIVVFYQNDPDTALKAALTHLKLTHPGIKMRIAGSLFVDILLNTLNGTPLKDAIGERLDAQDNPLMGHSYQKYLKDPDEWVIGSRFSTACYVEHSVPAVIYLALKYHADPKAALIANTNLGGDSASRGAVLGALLGAEHGTEQFPQNWVNGLFEPLPELQPGRG